MIVAIERTKFTYLYKYNQIRVDISQLIDKPTNDLIEMLQNDFDGLVQLFNLALPLFEQDHEIILLEIDKNKISLQNGILISFDSINCIYPITKTGKQLLEGKINDDFIVEPPVFEKGVEALRITRSMEFRKAASDKLLAHFKLSELLNKEMLSTIEVSVRKNLLDKTQPQEFNTFLDHLIAYNKTPSYIPDGHIEYICKIGAIAIKLIGKPEEVFTNGPFYKSCLHYKNQINTKRYHDSYKSFLAIPDESLKSSYKKIMEVISKGAINIDMFRMSYFFLAFKAYLNKNDNKLQNLEIEIQELKKYDERVAAFVLALIGYTFSFEQLYESIHFMHNVPLLMTSQKYEQDLQVNDETLKNINLKTEDIDHKNAKQQIDEQIAEKDISGFKEVKTEEGNPELKEIVLDESSSKKNIETGAQEKVEKNIEQDLSKQTKVNEHPISIEKPKRKSKGKEKVINKNTDTPVVNKPEKKTDQPVDDYKVGKTGDLFSQPNPSSVKDMNFYDNDELIKIVRIVLKNNIINDGNHLKTFEDAIMNYSPKGGQKDHLINEIEILQKELSLTQEVADKLKSVIIKVKE